MGITAEDKEKIREIFRAEPLSEKHIKQMEKTFVTKGECAARVDETKDCLSRDFARFGVLETKVNIILGILSAIGAAFLALIAKQLWGA